MKILITGAGGMVGSHMVELLYNKGEEVIGTYYKPTIDINELNSNIKMIECDIRYSMNILKVIKEFQPDRIFHLAAQSYPTVSWDKPYETIDININGTIAVFEAVKEVKNISNDYDPVIVVACSSAEYGETLEHLNTPYVKESDPLLPLHPYGVSKVGQDLISFQYYKNDNIKSIRARIFNTTGTRKINDVTSDFTKRAIEQYYSNTTEKCLKVGNINTRRAIMDVSDLINALLLLSEKGTYGDVYNISSESIYRIKDIIEIIERKLDIKFKIECDEKLLRPTDEKIIVGDVTKLKKDTGWKQEKNLDTTIEEMLGYWKFKLNRGL